LRLTASDLTDRVQVFGQVVGRAAGFEPHAPPSRLENRRNCAESILSLAIGCGAKIAAGTNTVGDSDANAVLAKPTGSTAKTCKTILLANPTAPSGVYDIDPTGTRPHRTFCDMSSAGG
jgi:hypothetical protein